MRTIKFRACKDDMSDYSFVYGSLVYNTEKVPLISVANGSEGLSYRSCIKGTEGQYIGFADKKGTDIYEGDIVRYTYIDDEGKPVYSDMQIFWNEHTAAFVYDDSYSSDKSSSQELEKEFCNEVEVVGNIHLNAELLDARE